MEEVKGNLEARVVATSKLNVMRGLPNPNPSDPGTEEILTHLRTVGVPEPKYTMIKLILESNL